MTVKGRRLLAVAAAVVFGGAVLAWDSPAYAQHRGYGHMRGRYYGGHRYYRSAPAWHGPSVHYDRYYHATSRHWTPYRGWHNHGHYDYVPHYVPGHYDRLHNGHVDLNPRFHR